MHEMRRDVARCEVLSKHETSIQCCFIVGPASQVVKGSAKLTGRMQ